jgi:hypothetical protein
MCVIIVMAKSFITSHHITSIIIHILGTFNVRRIFTCFGSNYGIGTTFGTALTTIPAFRPTRRATSSTPYVALQYPVTPPVTPPFLKHLPESQVPLKVHDSPIGFLGMQRPSSQIGNLLSYKSRHLLSVKHSPRSLDPTIAHLLASTGLVS